MEQALPRSVPEKPKLRPVEPQWVQYEGRQFVHLRDPLGLADKAVLVPEALAPLLVLCDGTRDVSGLRAALLLQTGLQLTPSSIEEFLSQLNHAFLLEGDAFKDESDRVLAEYRNARHRPLSHAGHVYPDDPADLSAALRGYCDRFPVDPSPQPASDLVGIVCPHIDYARGHAIYAQLWQRAAPALSDIDLAIVFGTDHSGGPGTLTLTRQSYATPLVVLPTEVEMVESVVDVLGPEVAFADEIHHVGEHSIELALVWLHHFLGGRPCPVVPVLCGSFHHFMTGDGGPAEDDGIGMAIAALREAAAGRRVIVIAAGDLAHVGPAFGDAMPLEPGALARIASQDAETLSAICDGDPDRLFEGSRGERDARRLCGLPPIYLALRYLGNAWGESLGYAQCPADGAGTSVVSIAGVLLYDGV